MRVPTVSVKVVGQDKLVAKFRYITGKAAIALKVAVNDGSLAIQRDAKRACPVDTGRLRSSILIQFLKGGLAATVGTNVSYAPFVEFGTGRRGRVGASYTGSVLPPGYRYGSKRGMAGKSYMYSSFRKNQTAILAAVKAAIKGAVI